MYTVLVPVYLLLITPITLSWWAAGNQLIMNQSLCRRPKMQKRFCNNPALIKQIERGIAVAHKECEYQFRHRKWNCTSSKKNLKTILMRDTRETGFFHAILAAGITYHITRACTTGDLLCSCNKSKRQRKKLKKVKEVQEKHWEWDNCGGENIDYGIKKSKEFLNYQMNYRAKSDMKTLVKLHNYLAGRLVIKNNMRKECKCHGLSGSCTLKTCWKKMPPFREIGNHLKERFDGATKVIAGNDGRSFMPSAEIKAPEKLDLVYSEELPSNTFCTKNETVGSDGTKGRLCDPKSAGEDGCDILCCSRGFDQVVVQENVSCKCQFEWCCRVNCQTCRITKTLNICL